MKKEFIKGLYAGLPIALGYLSVSFGFGIMAISLGLPLLSTVLISLTNLTSAGQAAGIEIIAAAGGFIEMALTQFIINIRYSLMGISLSQKLDRSFTTPKRILLSFGITDEVFAVASSQKGRISPSFMAGLIILPIAFWTLGTFLGGFAGQLLPKSLVDALGILLYGMFIAIILPPSRKNKKIFAVVVFAAALSIVFKFLLPFISSGFAVIICSLSASVLGALLFPVKEEDAV